MDLQRQNVKKINNNPVVFTSKNMQVRRLEILVKNLVKSKHGPKMGK